MAEQQEYRVLSKQGQSMYLPHSPSVVITDPQVAEACRVWHDFAYPGQAPHVIQARPVPVFSEWRTVHMITPTVDDDSYDKRARALRLDSLE